MQRDVCLTAVYQIVNSAAWQTKERDCDFMVACLVTLAEKKLGEKHLTWAEIAGVSAKMRLDGDDVVSDWLIGRAMASQSGSRSSPVD